jgi:lipopolysaccharide transport system ATP-binding protein
MNPIIKVENLGKKYILSHQQQESYVALRDVIARKCTAAGKKLLHPFTSHLSPFTASSKEDFWALKDVSFEIQQGDRVGIIGRNGAGKSTLLKILSRITEPTSGRIGINGRVASLLEVGTGFHPELTGRENIYLNGAILGMSRIEIKQKFDEIVAFAEVEKFLDTPVKHFSSGMYVRLAFAVAAHLEPEVLIVDEVLAVGDAQFQKKCLGKMQDVSTKEGRTVLFVSHQMEAISNLCSRAMLLHNGMLLESGPTRDVIDRYLQSARKLDMIPLRDRKDRNGNGRIRFTATWTENAQRQHGIPVLSGDTLTIVAEYELSTDEKISSVRVAFALMDNYGTQFTDLTNILTDDYFEIQGQRRGEFRCTITRLPLNTGRYSYHAYVCSSLGSEDFIRNAGYFDVEVGDFFNTGRTVDLEQGALLIDQHWSLS